MPLSARACKTCRARRIKCDASKPICNRCVKAKRDCQWDPNVQDVLLFKNENAFAKGQPRRPKNDLVNLDFNTKLPEHIEQPPALPVEIKALQYFAANFVYRPDTLPDCGHEYGTYIFPYWACSPKGSSLHLALYALAHATYGRAICDDTVIAEADKLYGKSIEKLRHTMPMASDADIDDLLLTIMIMALYENVVYSKQSAEPESSSTAIGSRFWRTTCHHEGAIGLLKLRQQRGMISNVPAIRAVRRQVIRACILKGIPVPEFLQTGADYGEKGPALDLDHLMVRTSILREKALQLSSALVNLTVESERKSAIVNAEASKLEEDLAEWPNALPADWRFSKGQLIYHISSDEPDLPGIDFADRYPSHAHAVVWLRYRAVRLIVNSIYLRTAPNWPDNSIDNVKAQARSQATVNAMADGICKGVPFFFSQQDHSYDITEDRLVAQAQILPKKAWLVAWVLAIAVSTAAVPQAQRKWLQHRLTVAARSLGDSALETVASRDEFRF